jgi:Cdc6-like AAA superfamily ATPase
MNRRNFIRGLCGATVAPIWARLRSKSTNHSSEEASNPLSVVTRFAENQPSHQFVGGRTGTGKSYELKQSLLRRRMAEANRGIIDPKGDLKNEL